MSINKEEFVKKINSLRLANKNNWYYWNGLVEGTTVQLKGYNTWLQILKVNGIDCSGPMDIRVGTFKRILEEAVQ